MHASTKKKATVLVLTWAADEAALDGTPLQERLRREEGYGIFMHLGQEEPCRRCEKYRGLGWMHSCDSQCFGGLPTFFCISS